MTRLYLTKTEGGDLVGWGPNDNAFLHRLGAGETIEADVRKARHPAHHRKFFALFNRAFQSQDRYQSERLFYIELKVRAGWYDQVIDSNGKSVYVPISLSWATMDQTVFDKFYREAIVALAQMCECEEVTLEADRVIGSTDFAGQEMQL